MGLGSTAAKKARSWALRVAYRHWASLLKMLPCAVQFASIASLLYLSTAPAAIPAAPHQLAAALLHDSGCHVPTTQDAQCKLDRTKRRAYPEPGDHCAWNASGLKTLEKRAEA